MNFYRFFSKTCEFLLDSKYITEFFKKINSINLGFFGLSKLTPEFQKIREITKDAGFFVLLFLLNFDKSIFNIIKICGGAKYKMKGGRKINHQIVYILEETSLDLNTAEPNDAKYQ